MKRIVKLTPQGRDYLYRGFDLYLGWPVARLVDKTGKEKTVSTRTSVYYNPEQKPMFLRDFLKQ